MEKVNILHDLIHEIMWRYVTAYGFRSLLHEFSKIAIKHEERLNSIETETERIHRIHSGCYSVTDFVGYLSEVVEEVWTD